MMSGTNSYKSNMKLKACCFCLAIDRQTTSIGNTALKDFIEGIFKSNGFYQDLSELHYTCHECKALLVKSYNFIQRSLRVQKLMLYENQTMTFMELKGLDRTNLGLSSKLSLHRVDIDFYIEENDNDFKMEDKPNLDTSFGTTTVINSNDDFEPIDAKDRYYEDIEVKNETSDDYAVDPFPDEIITYVPYMPSDIIDNNIVKTETNRKGYIVKTGTANIRTGLKQTNVNRKNRGRCTKTRNKRASKRKEQCDMKKKPEEERVYPRKCDHCNYEIELKKMHYRHYLYLHPNIEFPYLRKLEFTCQFCGISKRTQKTLQEHELTHGEKNKQCPLCPSKFHNHTQLYKHNLRHHSYKQFVCNYCGKGIKFKNELVLHIRTHTGEKPFKCHICGAGFAHKGNVGIHIRSAHQSNTANSKRKRKSLQTQKPN